MDSTAPKSSPDVPHHYRLDDPHLYASAISAQIKYNKVLPQTQKAILSLVPSLITINFDTFSQRHNEVGVLG